VVAGILLIIMLGMAAAGLALALGTWKTRESRHPKPLFDVTPQGVYTPAELPSLGYLPADSNVVAGIHVRSILANQQLAEVLHSPLPGSLAGAFAMIEKNTGLRLGAIDHIALGTTVGPEIPQLTIVARTNQPYTLEQIAHLHAQKPIPQHKRPLFRFTLEPTGGGYLWCADERTLIMTIRPDAVKIEDMDRIPASPRHGAEGFSPQLREILATRLRDSVLWIAGVLENPEFLDALTFFAHLTPQQAHLARGIRTFDLGLFPSAGISLLGEIEARDEQSVLTWKDYLEKISWPGVKDRRIITTPKGASTHRADFQFRVEPSDVRATVQALPFTTPKD
jgi:hypothetical protein